MTALFHHDLIVVTLGSGSKGNATYIGDGRQGVLVDCGISTKQIDVRLDAAGLGGTTIEAVLVTHEHSDHVGAARVLDKKLSKLRDRDDKLPFYMTQGTAECLSPRVRPRRIEIITPGQPFQVGKWTIEPHTVPHDTLDPVCFVVEHGGTRAGVITDLGHAPRSLGEVLSTLDTAVVEFNHDEQMLLEGTYPWSLKQRIKGRHGHLSNRQAAGLVAVGASKRLRHLVLAHLSDENNLPAKALACAEWALDRSESSGVTVHVGAQREPTPQMIVRGGAPIVTPPARRRVSPARSGGTAVAVAAQPSLFGGV